MYVCKIFIIAFNKTSDLVCRANTDINKAIPSAVQIRLCDDQYSKISTYFKKNFIYLCTMHTLHVNNTKHYSAQLGLGIIED